MSRGFTVLELMTTIAILAVVAGFGIPTFVTSIENTRAQTGANDFLLSIVQARNEAVKRNKSVVICKSSTGTGCASSGGWEQGWMSFVSTNATYESGEEIFASHLGLSGGTTLRAVSGHDDTLFFLSDGSTGFTETFNVCVDDDTSRGRSIDISVTGRPSRDTEATQCP